MSKVLPFDRRLALARQLEGLNRELVMLPYFCEEPLLSAWKRALGGHHKLLKAVAYLLQVTPADDVSGLDVVASHIWDLRVSILWLKKRSP